MGLICEDASAAARCLRGEPLGLVAFDLHEKFLGNTHLYFPQLMRAERILPLKADLRAIAQLRNAELFVQWGIKPTLARKLFHKSAEWLGRDRIIAEDGFIRSIGIGRSGEPGLSIILDDTTAYYDAKKISRLESAIQNSFQIDDNQKQRARYLIDLIVERRISKYNHSNIYDIPFQGTGRPKILVVDQRFGDASISGALATKDCFARMLEDALSEWPEHEILVKQHPDAISGGMNSYFSRKFLAPYMAEGRVKAICHDVNPYALFDAVDAVYVVSSGMGFEAIMANKAVYCYGVPFYAGWGLTQDRGMVPARRSARVSIEAVFHHAYIALSRYFDPRRGQLGEIEDTIDAILRRR